MKRVLLLCSSHNDLGTIRALRKLGYYIIVTGNIANLPGQKWVDKYIQADYSDKERILDIAIREQVDNICACCNDFGVYTAAYVAEKLGLAGYDSYDVTLTLHNKDRFKEFAQKNGITTPFAYGFDEYTEAKKRVSELELPVIVKPVDCSAGNGISVVKEATDIDTSLSYAFESSRSSRIVVEPYIVGSQHGFCTYLLNKKVVAVCSNNEYSFENPYRVEIDTYPASNYNETQGMLIDEIEKIAGILNLKDGIFHLQYIVSDGKPWIIEVMRRTLGNMYHVLGNELNGINWEYWETRARCGLDCSEFPKNIKQEGYYAYKTILAPRNGIIKNIRIPENYNKYIFDEYYLMKPGDSIENYLNKPIGFLFMMFSNEQEMLDLLIKDYRKDLVEMA